MRIAAQAAAMGSNIRVGLEDSLWAGRGKLAKSNAEQVALARKIIRLGEEVATPTRREKSWRSRAATRSHSRESRMLRIEVVCADRDQLGEGPLWDVAESRLYWIDSYGPAIHVMDAKGGGKRSWRVPEPIGSMALRRGGGAVLSLRSGFHLFDFETGEVQRIYETQPGELRARLNDGKVDRQGRFVAGSMDFEERDGVGKLFRLDPDLTVHQLDDGIICSNGPCWSSRRPNLLFRRQHSTNHLRL